MMHALQKKILEFSKNSCGRLSTRTCHFPSPVTPSGKEDSSNKCMLEQICIGRFSKIFFTFIALVPQDYQCVEFLKSFESFLKKDFTEKYSHLLK